MNTENFNKIIHEQIERCENALCKKAVREKAENRSDIIRITPKIGETLVQFKQRVIDLAFENKRDAFGEFKGAKINAHYGERGVFTTVDPSNCSERIVFI